MAGAPRTIAALAALSTACWAGVLAHPAAPWRLLPRDDVCDTSTSSDDRWPAVGVVVPARNEASTLPHTLPALLSQSYEGSVRVVLVDDRSEDGTARVARSLGGSGLTVVSGEPLPDGWVGKVWAVHQGVHHLMSVGLPEFMLATDADILHAPDSLRRLVDEARFQRLDLVSRMALLRCDAFAERLLVPPFVLFFNLLYPMRWANRTGAHTAAAAGGCMLLRTSALDRAGGYAGIRDSLIDDLALARAVKRSGGAVRLSVSTGRVASVRSYESIGAIWRMVRRSAYTQLRRSPVVLAGVTAALGLMFAPSPLAVAVGASGALRGRPTRSWAPALVAGAAGWALSAAAATPAVRLYRLPSRWAWSLPAAGLLYGGMTIDSALRGPRPGAGGWR